MVHGGIHGPGGVPRPLARCNQQVIIELVTSRPNPGNIDEGAIEDEIDQVILNDVSVSTQAARIDPEADIELVITKRSSRVLSEEVGDMIRITREQLNEQNLGFEVGEWRVQA